MKSRMEIFIMEIQVGIEVSLVIFLDKKILLKTSQEISCETYFLFSISFVT